MRRAASRSGKLGRATTRGVAVAPGGGSSVALVTVEQLISQRGDVVVASTVLEKATCTNVECIGSKMPSR